MKAEEYQNIDTQSDFHFWYLGTRNLLEKCIKLHCKNGHLSILDAGCGPGANFPILKKFGNTIGIDNSKIAVKLAKKRGEKATIGNLLKLPFKNNYFDLVVCTDVLYHQDINCPEKVIKEFNRVLRTGGIFISREPAFEFLRRSHDQIVKTERRFTKTTFLKLLKLSGFKTVKISYSNFLFFFFIIIKKVVESIFLSTPESDIKLPPKFLNSTLLWIMKSENSLLKKINLPLGSSIVYIGQKIS